MTSSLTCGENFTFQVFFTLCTLPLFWFALGLSVSCLEAFLKRLSPLLVPFYLAVVIAELIKAGSARRAPGPGPPARAWQ